MPLGTYQATGDWQPNVAAFRAFLGRMLGPHGGRGAAVDAGQVLAAAEQLKAVSAQLYERADPPLESASLIAREEEVRPWATSTGFRRIEGSAKMAPLGGLGQDRPRAALGIEEVTQPVRSFGNGYGFTRKEMAVSAYLNQPLDPIYAGECLRAFEELVDKLAAEGDENLGLYGVLTIPEIQANLYEGIEIGPNSSSEKILVFLHSLASNIRSRTNKAHAPDVLVLPELQRRYLASRTYNTSSNGETLLQIFLKNSEDIKEVVSWERFKAKGDTDESGNRKHYIGAWRKLDPMVLRQQIPEPFFEHEPQVVNGDVIVDCEASIGGVESIRPAAVQLSMIENNDSELLTYFDDIA